MDKRVEKANNAAPDGLNIKLCHRSASSNNNNNVRDAQRQKFLHDYMLRNSVLQFPETSGEVNVPVFERCAGRC